MADASLVWAPQILLAIQDHQTPLLDNLPFLLEVVQWCVDLLLSFVWVEDSCSSSIRSALALSTQITIQARSVNYFLWYEARLLAVQRRSLPLESKLPLGRLLFGTFPMRERAWLTNSFSGVLNCVILKELKPSKWWVLAVLRVRRNLLVNCKVYFSLHKKSIQVINKISTLSSEAPKSLVMWSCKNRWTLPATTTHCQ